jgi:hypothetical protein
MSQTKKITNLRRLKLSPKINPLVEQSLSIRVKNSMVATKMSNDLVDTQTGEQHNHALIHTLKVVDNQNFVLSNPFSPFWNVRSLIPILSPFNPPSNQHRVIESAYPPVILSCS